MDADKRHETHESKGKYSTQSNNSSQRIIIFAFVLQISVPTGWYKASSDMWTHGWLQARNPGNVIFYTGGNHTSSLLWKGNTLPSKTISKPFLAPEVDSFSNCQSHLLYKHLQKDHLKERHSVFITKWAEKCTPMDRCLPTNTTHWIPTK